MPQGKMAISNISKTVNNLFYGDTNDVRDDTTCKIQVRYNSFLPKLRVALRTNVSSITKLATIPNSAYYPATVVTLAGSKGGICYLNTDGEIYAQGSAWEEFCNVYPKI